MEKQLEKNLTEVVFILDRSGSMGGLEADTIGGYNSMLKKQQEEEGDVVISTVLFDDRTEVIHDRKNLSEVKPLTEKEYYVRGCTALLDAVGGAIHHIGTVQKELPKEERPDKTIFIITTDGMENSSSRYTYEKVKKMVEKKKEKKGWEFIFLGANIDAIDVAGRFGVDRSRAVRYESDGFGHELNYSVVSNLVSCARSAISPMAMKMSLDSDESLQAIREDYEELQEISKDRSTAPDYDVFDEDTLKKYLESANEREKKVLTTVFGLDGMGKKTYAEAGKICGITEGRTHQMVEKARRKMNH